MTWINTIINLYQNTIFRYTRLSSASIVFTLCCAINYQWLNFTNRWFPLEKYLSQGTISTIQYGLQCAEVLFPLLTGILLIILCFHLSTSSYQLVNMAVPSKEIEKIARVLGYISQYLIMNFWLYYFIIRTIVFGNFYISQSFSMGWHWLSPNYYLVYFFSLLTISDVIFAPIHYRHAKRRQLEAYLERREKMLTKNDKS